MNVLHDPPVRDSIQPAQAAAMLLMLREAHDELVQLQNAFSVRMSARAYRSALQVGVTLRSVMCHLVREPDAVDSTPEFTFCSDASVGKTSQ